MPNDSASFSFFLRVKCTRKKAVFLVRTPGGYSRISVSRNDGVYSYLCNSENVRFSASPPPPALSNARLILRRNLARGILLRVYGIFFSIFIILGEMEWAKFTKFFGFLKYWPARGLFYMFVGLITWDQVRAFSLCACVVAACGGVLPPLLLVWAS